MDSNINKNKEGGVDFPIFDLPVGHHQGGVDFLIFDLPVDFPIFDLPVGHHMTQFFNVSGLTKKVVLFAGVQGAGKIRITAKLLWRLFGGDANWNNLLAVHTLPLMYRSLGLGALKAGPSKDYLKRLITDSPYNPPPLSKPLSLYAFEMRLDILGEELHSFVPSGFFDDVGVNRTKSICVHLPDEYGRRLTDAFRELKKATDGDEFEELINVDITARVFDRGTGKFATLARTTTMTMKPAGPRFSSTFEHYAIYDHLDVADDHLGVTDDASAFPRSPIVTEMMGTTAEMGDHGSPPPIESVDRHPVIHNRRSISSQWKSDFYTRTVIQFLSGGQPCLGIIFTDRDRQDEDNRINIEGLMEQLQWK